MKANEAILLALDMVRDEFPGNIDQDMTIIVRDIAYENIRLAESDDPEERRQIEFNLSTLETLLVVESAIHRQEIVNFCKKLAMKALILFITKNIF